MRDYAKRNGDCMTFAEFIIEKRPRVLALAMGVKEPTTYSWQARNCIPRSRWDRLISLYPDLTFRKLVDMEIASKTAD